MAPPAAKQQPGGATSILKGLAKALAVLAGLAALMVLLANFQATSKTPRCPHIPTLVNCTNKAFPVLGGADVVSFFDREQGTPPAQWSEAHQHTYLGYT